MHAQGPFTVHRIQNQPDDPLNNSYVIKDGRRVIIAGVPYHEGDAALKYAEGTARLICAGLNHIQNVLAAAERVADFLNKYEDRATRDERRDIQDFITAFGRAADECPAP